MPTLGTTTKPSSYWHAYSSSNPNIELERLEAPRKIRVLEVGVWAGGWNGTCRARLGVWAADGTQLGRSAQITFANEGSGGPSGGNVARYVAALETPAELEAGALFYVGFVRNPADGHQISGGATSTTHYEDTAGGAGWADAVLTSPASVARRYGAYVADYVELAGAYVRRGGAWARADDVLARRAGAWASVDTIAARRSGAWADAE